MCGTLFIDKASGKLFNFYQLWTEAKETIRNKHKLEAKALAVGVFVGIYSSDNEVFASAVL